MVVRFPSDAGLARDARRAFVGAGAPGVTGLVLLVVGLAVLGPRADERGRAVSAVVLAGDPVALMAIAAAVGAVPGGERLRRRDRSLAPLPAHRFRPVAVVRADTALREVEQVRASRFAPLQRLRSRVTLLQVGLIHLGLLKNQVSRFVPDADALVAVTLAVVLTAAGGMVGAVAVRRHRFSTAYLVAHPSPQEATGPPG